MESRVSSVVPCIAMVGQELSGKGVRDTGR
jgi:hypothetical protein